jgi:hypothetical protein
VNPWIGSAFKLLIDWLQETSISLEQTEVKCKKLKMQRTDPVRPLPPSKQLHEDLDSPLVEPILRAASAVAQTSTQRVSMIQDDDYIQNQSQFVQSQRQQTIVGHRQQSKRKYTSAIQCAEQSDSAANVPGLIEQHSQKAQRKRPLPITAVPLPPAKHQQTDQRANLTILSDPNRSLAVSQSATLKPWPSRARKVGSLQRIGTTKVTLSITDWSFDTDDLHFNAKRK